jgi:hypothetical protein
LSPSFTLPTLDAHTGILASVRLTPGPALTTLPAGGILHRRARCFFLEDWRHAFVLRQPDRLRRSVRRRQSLKRWGVPVQAQAYASSLPTSAFAPAPAISKLHVLERMTAECTCCKTCDSGVAFSVRMARRRNSSFWISNSVWRGRSKAGITAAGL